MKRVNLGANSKIRIDWHTLPMDYSHEMEEEIISKIKNKYGVSREQIRINPIITTNQCAIDGDSIDNNITYNIQHPEFQRKLFQQYIKEKNIKDYDFDTIVEIDNYINEKIDYSLYEPNKQYFVKWIKWDNFMSYGSGNYFDFRSLNGLVLLSSDPANQGGKTTFCLDLIRFLLFGKVTSRESDWTLSKVFNKYLPEATDVVVEGCITIDGVDYIIKRTVNRPQLKKRTDKSKVTQKVEYYKLVNDEYISLADEECENGVGTKETNQIIKDTIGNESDFDLMICVDSDNLKGLISLKDTERGKLISRWIGLIVLQKKDEIARKVYNDEIVKSMVVSKYNKEDLKNDNEICNGNIVRLTEENKRNLEQQSVCIGKIDKYQKNRDMLMSSIENIDKTLLTINVESLQNELEKIKNEGTIKRGQVEEYKKEFNKIESVEYSLDEYNSLKSQENILNEEVISGRVKYKTLENEINLLKKSEYCPTCGAKLQGVDNTDKIREKEREKEELSHICIEKKNKKEAISKRISEIDALKINSDKKNKLELLIIKIESDINILLTKYKDINNTLKLISKNKEAIEKNNEIDIKIQNIDVLLKNEKEILDRLKQNIVLNNVTIENNQKQMKANSDLLDRIKNEERLMNNWRLYLDMIGKNGISKLVVRTVLPQINSELKRLLFDVCDFDVEVNMDDRNDVEFNIIHDGVTSNLASGSGFEQTVASLALRTVLSKISTFSKPSFVVFDEILGGVAADNYDAVKKLYDKILTQHQCILFITHNVAHKEWADKTITVTKRNNISTIKLE